MLKIWTTSLCHLGPAQIFQGQAQEMPLGIFSDMADGSANAQFTVRTWIA